MEQDCPSTQLIDGEGKQDFSPTQSIDCSSAQLMINDGEEKQDCTPTQSIDCTSMQSIDGEGKQDCSSTQLIDGDGVFNVAGVESFMRSLKFRDCGVSYAVIAIMGPQSSGKSTLLNNLFLTEFAEMDAKDGRTQTTLGIWMGKAVDVEPFTMVLDIEGNDGKERKEQENTAFEKQTALFALALADVVLINMWCSDIGLESGGSKPVLRTVFQVMVQLFPPRQTTLLFVIRDISLTPLDKLETSLKDDLDKIWKGVTKPEDRPNAKLSDFFNVMVTGLGHYVYQRDLFNKQVAELRKQFQDSIAPGGLAGNREGVVPASAFSYSAQQIWEVIRGDKNLNLPSHNVMVATVRCEEIANEKFVQLSKDENWLELESAAKTGPVFGFGEKLSKLLETPLSEYDKEAMYFTEHIRDDKRNQLESKLLELVRPAYENLLSHLLSQADERFKIQLEEALNRGDGFAASVRDCEMSCLVEFDKQCQDAIVQQAVDWDDSNDVRERLKGDIKAHSSSLCSDKLSEIVDLCKEKITNNIEKDHVETLLIAGKSDSWSSVRELLKRHTDTVTSEFLESIAGFELDQSSSDVMLQSLRDHAKSLVEKKARELAKVLLLYMKDSFTDAFKIDWEGYEDITKITLDAQIESMKILSVMTVTRFDDGPDNIESILSSCLIDDLVSDDGDMDESGDPLASHVWDAISPEDTIVTPMQCKSLWIEFLAATESTISQSKSAKDNIASLRCDEIANEKYNNFRADERWVALEDAVNSGPVSDFGEQLSPILEIHLSEYDEETMCFDEHRHDYRRQLSSKLLEFVHATYKTLLGHLLSQATETFKTRLEEALSRGEGFEASVHNYEESCMHEFDQQCADAVVQQAVDWDASNVRERLRRDIDAHSSSLRRIKLTEIVARCEKKLLNNIGHATKTALKSDDGNSWLSIRNLLKSQTDTVALEFVDYISGFNLDQSTCDDMVRNLQDYARSQIVEKARETAKDVVLYMKDRFSIVLNPDGEYMPSRWNGTEDMTKIILDAQTASLKLLAVMAAIRLDEGPDNIEKHLLLSCLTGQPTAGFLSDGDDPQDSSVWEEVSPENTLITPVQCESLWAEFVDVTKNSVARAIKDQADAAVIRSAEDVHAKVDKLRKDKEWSALQRAAKSGQVSNFGERLTSILETHLLEFDKESMEFEEVLRGEKRKKLETKLLEHVHPTYEALLGQLLSQATTRFKTQLNEALARGEGFAASVRDCEKSCKTEFDKQCADSVVRQADDWDSSHEKEELKNAIETYSSSFFTKKLSAIVDGCKKKLRDLICPSTEHLLQDGAGNSWDSIRELLKKHTDDVVKEFRESVSGFELDESTIDDHVKSLKEYGRSELVGTARETANSANRYLKDRFTYFFMHDHERLPRQWRIYYQDTIRICAHEAREKCITILAVMAVIRLQTGSEKIDGILRSGLNSAAPLEMLNKGLWDGVTPDDTLLTPVQCTAIWKKFVSETHGMIEEGVEKGCIMKWPGRL